MSHLSQQFEHLKIQLEAIKCATNNFADDRCIGRGGFGKVYKGELLHSKGQIVVALKRLDPILGQGNPEFWKEIIMLSQYKHRNIVSLLGFCDEGNEKILVYEYAPRKSLELYLSDANLSWIDRLKICIGAGRGLAYLHNPNGTQQRVLHRDVKSSNILLDENWNAKLSDLGLSKFGPANQQYTFAVSNPVGTIGYCDPLYYETGILTKESDVYSFGVVLFEVLSGRLCITRHKNGTIHDSLTSLVREYYPQNKINEIIYGNMKDKINPKSLEMFTTIAYKCLKRDLKQRPLMADVVKMLESALGFQVGTFINNEIENIKHIQSSTGAQVQVMQPKDVRARILKHFKRLMLGQPVDDEGHLNLEIMARLFRYVNKDTREVLSRSDLGSMLVGMRLDKIHMELADVVDLVMEDFDTSENDEIDFAEFVTGIGRWLEGS